MIKTNTYPATSNKQVAIPDKEKNIVLYFYPRDATPGCTQEGLDFSAFNKQFNTLNTVIYGVSRDSLKSHEKFKDKQNFSFDLISDGEEKLCQLFDVIKPKNSTAKNIWELCAPLLLLVLRVRF